jgi:hypothetical protein
MADFLRQGKWKPQPVPAAEFALLSALPERFTAAPWLALRFAPSVDGLITQCGGPSLSSKGTPASLRAVVSPFA